MRIRIPMDLESLLARIHTFLPHIGTILTTPPDCKSQTICTKHIGEQGWNYEFHVECPSGKLPTYSNDLQVSVNFARKTFRATPTIILEDGESRQLQTKEKWIAAPANSGALLWDLDKLRLTNVIVDGLIGMTELLTDIEVIYRSKRTRLP